MTSPSVRSTSRSTPCVDGCCGPMLTSISSVRTSNSMTVGSSFGRFFFSTVAMIHTSGHLAQHERLFHGPYDPDGRLRRHVVVLQHLGEDRHPAFQVID